MQYSDAELVRLVLSGDEDAFTSLVNKYQKQVHAIAWRIVGDYHIAEEIAQDAFLNAYLQLNDLKEPQRFAGWLTVITRRQCYAWLRKKRVSTESYEYLQETDSELIEGAIYSDYVIEEKQREVAEEQREAVDRLLANLQENERTVITLYYFNEMTCPEIGEYLGISENTIKSRLYRAQQRIKKHEHKIREMLEDYNIAPMKQIIRRETMSMKYESNDFWYKFLNSLHNYGLSSGSGDLEIDEEMQEKILTYLKEKIEEGVTDGETALPPGLHDYAWRIPKEVLPKLRSLANSFLETDPENAAAHMILTIVAGQERDHEHQAHLEKLVRLVPKDPGTNLIIIHEFHRNYGDLRGNFDGLETFLTVLDNLYEWAIHEGTTDRYRDVKSSYNHIGRSPGTVYGRTKKKLLELKEDSEDPDQHEERKDEVAECKARIRRCIDLFSKEQKAFQKESLQELDEKHDYGNPTSDKIDFWETYLKSLDDQELSSSSWKLTPKVQTQLLTYFKKRVEVGVVDGQTTLPAELQKYVSRFPKVMRIELQEFAEEALETQPNNGAAAKVLAILVDKNEFPYLEQAIDLLPNNAEICFSAMKRYSGKDNAYFEKTLPALEKLFERAQQQGGSELYSWLTKLYKDIGKTPCYIYRKLMRHPEANSEQIERCKPLIDQAEKVFLQRLEVDADDWYALRGLGDIYQTLGQTELARKYPWEPHIDDRHISWNKKAWEGLELPNFSATTLDGAPFTLSDYRGKLILLNFCAWWCGPCKTEIPYIKQVYEEHHKNGLEVIRISVDESEADLRKHIEEHEIPGIQLFEKDGWLSGPAKFFGVYSIPSIWLIDRDGKIVSFDSRQQRLVQRVNRTEALRVGDMIPDFSVVDLDGNTVSPSTCKGKVVLLVLGYPEKILKGVEAIYDKYHSHGFHVVVLNIFGWPNEEAFREVLHEDYIIGNVNCDTKGLNSPLAREFGIGFDPTRPAVVLIDKSSKIVMSRYEHVHSQAAWIAKLEELVQEHL